jgi:DNA-binding MarR family transcriptional regulator
MVTAGTRPANAQTAQRTVALAETARLAAPSLLANILLLTIVVVTTNFRGMGISLQRDLRQRRPFPSIQEQVLVNLLRTTDRLTGTWTQFLRREEGLSPSLYNILRILRGAHPDGHRISDIAERMITRDPDVTRLVDRLVERDLARRERDADDRRVVRVAISPAGLALLDRLDPVLARCTLAAMRGLPATRLRALDTLLDELREGIAHPFP